MNWDHLNQTMILDYNFVSDSGNLLGSLKPFFTSVYVFVFTVVIDGCGLPPEVSEVTLSYSDTTIGSVAIYSCGKNKYGEHTTATCQPSGDPSQVTCRSKSIVMIFMPLVYCIKIAMSIHYVDVEGFLLFLFLFWGEG